MHRHDNRRLKLMLRFTCVFAALTFASAPSSLDAQATQPKSTSRAELFIKTFGPPSNSTSLRASDLEQQEQVRLAFYGIDSTRAQMARGTLDQETGNRSIDGFEQTIRNYIHDNVNEALLLANQGRVSDVAAIARPLAGVLSIARQDSLMGHEELAKEAQNQMVKILTAFSQKFSETCYDQSFDPGFALGLQRQNDKLGTGIDVTPCAKRLHTFQTGPNWEWKNCSFWGEGEWVIELTDPFSGRGSANVGLSADNKTAEGTYSFKYTVKADADNASWEEGDIKLITHEERSSDGTLIKREMTADNKTRKWYSKV
jgi:hypothetical protein